MFGQICTTKKNIGLDDPPTRARDPKRWDIAVFHWISLEFVKIGPSYIFCGVGGRIQSNVFFLVVRDGVNDRFLMVEQLSDM